MWKMMEELSFVPSAVSEPRQALQLATLSARKTDSSSTTSRIL